MRICKTLEQCLPLSPLDELKMNIGVTFSYTESSSPREPCLPVEDVAAHSILSEESLHKIFLRHKYCIFI